jgi:hypothetical protein
VLLVRDIMYCKPGKVRAMVEKSIAMSARSASASVTRASCH